MNFRYKAAVLVTGLAVGVTPALATAHGHSGTPLSRAKTLCKSEPKHHVAGQTGKGTAFSECVSAAVQKANGSTKNPTTLCKGESKKKTVRGTHGGTPYSLCVRAAARAHRRGTGTTTTTSTTTGTTSTTSGS